MAKRLWSSIAIFILYGFAGLDCPGYALCLASSGENNCSTFSGNSVSQVVQTYLSNNRSINRYFQMGFGSRLGTYVLGHLAWSADRSGDTSFSVLAFEASAVAFPYGFLFNLSPSLFRKSLSVRHDIRAPFPDGFSADFKLLDRNTEDQFTGVVSNADSSDGAIVLSHAIWPASFPMEGVAAVFSQAKPLNQQTAELR